MSGLRISFIALISRDNKPIHIEQFGPSNDSSETSTSASTTTLTSHFLANMALDVFLSPLYTGEPGSPSLLFTQDATSIYGYETNTGLRILVAVNGELTGYDALFKKLHRVYLGMVVSPFGCVGSLSKKIRRCVDEVQPVSLVQ